MRAPGARHSDSPAQAARSTRRHPTWPVRDTENRRKCRSGCTDHLLGGRHPLGVSTGAGPARAIRRRAPRRTLRAAPAGTETDSNAAARTGPHPSDRGRGRSAPLLHSRVPDRHSRLATRARRRLRARAYENPRVGTGARQRRTPWCCHRQNSAPRVETAVPRHPARFQPTCNGRGRRLQLDSSSRARVAGSRPAR